MNLQTLIGEHLPGTYGTGWFGSLDDLKTVFGGLARRYDAEVDVRAVRGGSQPFQITGTLDELNTATLTPGRWAEIRVRLVTDRWMTTVIYKHNWFRQIIVNGLDGPEQAQLIQEIDTALPHQRSVVSVPTAFHLGVVAMAVNGLTLAAYEADVAWAQPLGWPVLALCVTALVLPLVCARQLFGVRVIPASGSFVQRVFSAEQFWMFVAVAVPVVAMVLDWISRQ